MNPPRVLDGPTGGPDEGEVSPPHAASSIPLRAALTRLVRQVWFWPTTVTLVVGGYRIGRPELWRDELRSWSAVARPTGDLVHLLGNTDAAVALYYLVLHGWVRLFGDSVVSMRVPSLLAMAGAAAGVSLIGRRLYGSGVGLTAGLIFAVIPAISRYAQEVRPYAITMLLVCASTLLYLRALDRPTRRRWLGYAASVAGVVLAQVVAAPVLAAHAAGLLIWKRRDRRTQITWAAWTALGLAAASPVIVLGLTQYDHQVGGLPQATLSELVTLPPRLFSSTIVSGAIITVCLFAFGRKVASGLFLTGWAVLPIVIVWLVSNLGQSYWMPRYLLPALPAFALLAGAGVMSIPRRPMLVLALVVLTTLGVPSQRQIRQVGAHDQWNYPYGGNAPVSYAQAAQLIAQRMEPGDGIMYLARSDFWLLDVGIAYHLRGRPQPADVMVQTSAVQRGDFWATECERGCGVDVPRIWLLATPIRPARSTRSLEPAKRQILEADYRIADSFTVPGIRVVLWERT